MLRISRSRYHWFALLSSILIPVLIFTLLVATHIIPLTSSPGKVSFLFATPIPNADRKPLQLSSDPYTNRISQHQTEVEPDTYSYNSTIVATFQVGRFQDGGSSNIGWATSTDSGATWTHGFLPGTTKLTGGPYDRISDPSVAYDAAHNTWIISSLAILGNSAHLTSPTIIVSLSTDGGLTWDNPIKVVDGGSTFYDKDWIVCDDTATSPYYGHCYIEWDEDNQTDLIQMSTSTDGGKTWGKAQATADSATGIGGQPLVQPNGTVIVPLMSGYGDSRMQAFNSTDGGKSWSSTLTVASPTSPALPTAEIDGSGIVYLVWTDCHFEKNCDSKNPGQENDLVMTTSTDGTHWTPVQRIPLAPAGSGMVYAIPGLGVDKTTSGAGAHLGLAFYYRSTKCAGSCQYSVGFVSSIDGGTNWSTKITLAGPMSVDWIAKGDNAFRLGVGDYISTSFCGGMAFPVFAVGTAPSEGHLNEAMYTITGGLSI